MLEQSRQKPAKGKEAPTSAHSSHASSCAALNNNHGKWLQWLLNDRLSAACNRREGTGTAKDVPDLSRQSTLLPPPFEPRKGSVHQQEHPQLGHQRPIRAASRRTRGAFPHQLVPAPQPAILCPVLHPARHHAKGLMRAESGAAGSWQRHGDGTHMLNIKPMVAFEPSPIFFFNSLFSA